MESLFRVYGDLAGVLGRWCAKLACVGGRDRMCQALSRGKIAKGSFGGRAYMLFSFLGWLVLRSRGPPRVKGQRIVVAAAGNSGSDNEGGWRCRNLEQING